MKKPIILAHRGYSALYPENTILAFQKALLSGADGWECDLQKTGDGRFIVVHDADLKRVSGNPGIVSELKLDEVKEYRLGKGETVPTLQETLKILPDDKILNLELKVETIKRADCPAIYAILREHGKSGFLILSSFDYGLLEYFRMRKMPVAYLAGNSRGLMSVFDFIFRSFTKAPDYQNIPVQALEGKYRLIGYPLAWLFRLLKKKMIFWVVNNGKQLAECLPFAYGIITDDPERMMKELADPHSN